MRRSIFSICCIACTAFLLALTVSVPAQVITTDPSLPVLYPTGFYTNLLSGPVYLGPGLAIVLSDEQHLAMGPVNRTNSGPDEIEDFNSVLLANISVNGGSNDPIIASGPVQTEVFGKVGNTTGVFNTEMLSLSLTGSSPLYGPFMIRESPTLASTGQTTITNIGGGLYHIDSFFDVFTELSIDGGSNWIQSTGPTRVTLMPEPSGFVLVGLGAGFLVLTGARRFRKKD